MFGFLKWTCNKHCWILSKLPQRIICLSGRTISVILRDFVFIQWLWVFELLCLDFSIFPQEGLCRERALCSTSPHKCRRECFCFYFGTCDVSSKGSKISKIRQFSLERRLVNGGVIKRYLGFWESCENDLIQFCPLAKLNEEILHAP